ncbi:MAG: hypothetical protein ACLFTT_14980 [Candidatus Hydrogenedentota bacterium]
MRLHGWKAAWLLLLAGVITLLIAVGVAAWAIPGFRQGNAATAAGAALAYGVLGAAVLGLAWVVRYKPKVFAVGLFWCAVAWGLAEAAIAIAMPELAMLRFRWLDSHRYHHIAPANQTMFKYHHYADGTPFHMRTNEDGLRTEYTRASFRAHAQRVVVMGDSFVFGFGERQKHALPQVMDRIFGEEARGGDVAVMNAGIVSYSPFLGKQLFDGIIRHYTPDVVLYCLDPTDFGDDIKYARLASEREGKVWFPDEDPEPRYFGAVIELAAFYSRLLPAGRAVVRAFTYPFDFLRKYLLDGAEPNGDYYAFRVRVGDAIEYNRYFIYRHPPEVLEPFFQNTLGHLNQLAAMVEETGATFVLVVVPRFHHWNPDASKDYWESDLYSVKEPYQFAYLDFFDRVKDELHYPVVNLLPAFESAQTYPLTIPGDAHWNMAGNRVAARALSDYLLREGYVR